jgi:hypothetical protein
MIMTSSFFCFWKCDRISGCRILYSYCLPEIVVCPVTQWLPSKCYHGGVSSVWCNIYRRIQLGLMNCLFHLFWTKGWWNCSHHLQARLCIWKKWSTTWDTTWVSVLSLDIWEVELEIRVSRHMAVTNKWDSVPYCSCYWSWSNAGVVAQLVLYTVVSS